MLPAEMSPADVPCDRSERVARIGPYMGLPCASQYYIAVYFSPRTAACKETVVTMMHSVTYVNA